ncbi:AAA family ATPase [Candidatus Poribacteria bacterium]|nr:AAA family ATPase [Candidatus Poribacteria bacterium]
MLPNSDELWIGILVNKARGHTAIMKILRLTIEGFGKISDLTLDLGEHLNVIYGKNESGKTTLKTFVYGMLYGFLRPGRQRRYYEEEYAKYRPWQDEHQYGGELVYALSSGQRFMVKRDFHTEEVIIYDADTWRDLTKNFPTYLREPQFAQEHLGIEKEIFRDCLYIKQQNIRMIESPQSLADRLQAIATTSTEELSLQQALGKLDSALNRIGTERGWRNHLLGQCVTRIERLQKESAEIKAKHDQLTESIDALDALKQKKSGILRDRQRLQYRLACVEIAKIEERLEEVGRLNEEIKQIEQKLTLLEPYQNFPVERRDELMQLNADSVSQQQRKIEIEEELLEPRGKLNEIQDKRKTFAHLEGLAPQTNIIDEKKQGWLDLEKERANLERTLQEQGENLRQLKSKRENHPRFRALNQQIQDASDRLKKLDTECCQAEYRLLLTEMKQLQETIERIESLHAQSVQVKQTLRNYHAYENFPVQRKDELLTLQARFSDMKQRTEEIEVKLSTHQEKLVPLQEQLQSLSGYEQLAETLEEIGNLESKYKFMVEEEEKRKDAWVKAQEAFDTQSDLLKADESKFRLMDSHRFEQVLQDVTNLQQNQTILSLRAREIAHEAERLQNFTHQMRSQKGQIKFLMSAGAAFLVAAAVCFAFIAPVSFILLPLGVLGWLFSFQKRQKVKVLERQMGELTASLENQKAEFEQRREELAAAQSAVDDLFEQVGVSSLDALKAEYAKLQAQSRKVEQLKERGEAFFDKLRETQAELEKTERRLQDLIELLRDSSLEGSIVQGLAVFRENYSRYQSLVEQSSDVKTEGKRLQSEHWATLVKCCTLMLQMAQILKAARVETVEAFLEGMDKQRLYRDAMENQTKCEGELKLLLGDRSLEDFKIEHGQKQTRLEAIIADFPEFAENGPVSAGLSQARRAYEQLSQERSTAEQTLRGLQTQREARLEESIESLEDSLAKGKARLDEIEQRQSILEGKLETILVKSKLFCSDAPFSIQPVETLLEQLRMSNQLRQQETEQIKAVKNQEEQLKNVILQLNTLQTQQKSILEQAGVETLEVYNEAWKRHQQYRNDYAEMRALMTTRDGRLGGQSLETWQQHLGELKTQIQNVLRDCPDLSNSVLNPNAATVDRHELDKISEGLRQVENQIHEVQGRIQTQMANSRPLHEIEEELEQATLEKTNLEKQKAALMLAKEQLEAVSREFFTTRFAPELREIVAPRLQAVTGQYGEIRFDETLNLKVRIPELNLVKDVGDLSQGTLDQIYFLLKAGIAQMLSKNREPLPLLLDDPFVACDDERLEGIWDVLSDLASQTQILLFTCHRWQMLDIAERFGRDVNAHALDVGDFALLAIDP